MSYILNERIPIEKAIFIHEMSYKDFKVYTSSCKNDEERKKLFNIVKCVVNNAINNNGSVNRTYKYSDSMETLGRLCSNGMQGVKKIFRGFLMSDTTDIDMDNAHPVILSYICKKHDIPCENLDYYNANRDDVLSSYPDKTRSEAKTHFLKCINNDKHNKNDKHVFYRKWDNEIKKIQFALSNLSEYNKICETVPDSRDYNVKGSQISRILGTYEDKILHVVLDTMKKKEIEVAVLMYDGCMVYGDWYKNTELLSQITEDVESEFNGLNMKWSYKPHNTDIVIPEGWKSKKMAKLLKENVEKVEIVEDVKIAGIYEGDDSGASKMILEKYPHWKCCNDVLYVFDDMTGMWSDKIDIQNNIISRYAEFLDIIKTGVDGTVKKTGRNYAKNNQKRKDIYPFIRENCVDNDWIVRTETSSLGKILFLNGHYDFKRSKFMTGKKISATDDEKKNTNEENGFNPEIVFFYRVDHELTEFNEDELAYMDSIQERLFTLPLGKDVGDYLTLNLARAFSGDITIKRILFGLGMSNSGKGILTKACQLSMGQYCGVFTGENLAFNNVNNDEAQKMRWAMLLRNKRLIISNELSTKKMLDGNLIKKLASGGDTIQGRLHGQHETDFKPQYLAILLANDMPDTKPFDTATQSRVRVYSYTKAFVDEPKNEYELKKDPNLDNEMKSRLFQRCFIGLLIRKYLEFQDNGCVEIEPNEVVVARNDWIGTTEENDIINKFQQFYEITNCVGDYVPSREVENCIRTMGDMSYKNFVMELKKNCILKSLKNVINNTKTVNNKKIQVWFGMKRIEDNLNYSDDITEEL